MQYDHILKKLNFDLLTLRVGGGGLQAKYLPACCCIRDSLLFDMQHDYVLKKLNFDLSIPPQMGGGGGRLRVKYLLG